MPPLHKKHFNEKLIARISQSKCDEIQILNLPSVVDFPVNAYETVKELLGKYKEADAKNRGDPSIDSTLEKNCQLGPVVDALNKRLQEHVRVLKHTETSTKQPNVVLEHDMAKRRADKLAEILRAKLVWDNCFEEMQLLDASDIELRYQKLGSLQQSFDVLRKYSLDQTKVDTFEKMKDEFLSWYSPATILAIDSNDLKQLENIKEKYLSLDRLRVFESNFGNYARNKIKCHIEDEGKLHSLWSILEETFAIWKRSHKLVDSFVEENGSELMCQHLHQGLTAKWDKIQEIVSNMVSTSENPVNAAKSIGNVLDDFLALVAKEGDAHILAIFTRLRQSLFSMLSEDYAKHVTSTLICTINKITTPERSSRQRHNWLMPFLEEVQLCMQQIVTDARSTFGADFASKIVPSFEVGVRELNSILQNQDILNIRPEGVDIRMRKTVHENTEDKISAICVTGFLINMIEDINAYIRETSSEWTSTKELGQSETPPCLISNLSLLETLNLKVVGRKIDSIANTIIYPMEEEMQKLIRAHREEQPSAPAGDAYPKEELSISLPSFSVSPHNYVTGIGHGLLSQMNAIGAHGSDRNFVRAIGAAAADTKAAFNEEEADLWLLTEVAKLVQNTFCSNIGNVNQLPPKLKRQFKADIVFLMDALSDLRLLPTSQLSKLAEKLKKETS